MLKFAIKEALRSLQFTLAMPQPLEEGAFVAHAISKEHFASTMGLIALPLTPKYMRRRDSENEEVVPNVFGAITVSVRACAFSKISIPVSRVFVTISITEGALAILDSNMEVSYEKSSNSIEPS